jgi:hypothetical protein
VFFVPFVVKNAFLNLRPSAKSAVHRLSLLSFRRPNLVLAEMAGDAIFSRPNGLVFLAGAAEDPARDLAEGCNGWHRDRVTDGSAS